LQKKAAAGSKKVSKKQQEDACFNRQWFVIKHPENGAYILKVVVPDTPKADILGYIFKTNGGRRKDDDLHWVRFVCSQGTVHLNLSKISKNNTDTTLRDVLDSSSKFTSMFHIFLRISNFFCNDCKIADYLKPALLN
jgi:hypothetical protein